ncbi:MAG: PEP-CTERM sorting domain-containing protein [Spirulina sp. SIO3F2]|nr:PEP-CTERM sorting domain-containing protein [Spirulina sp. SIO3F2]
MQSLFSNAIKPYRATTISAGVVGAIVFTTFATPTYAAPITVDFDGGVDALIASDDQFAQFLADLGYAIPDGAINEVISGSITVDDDPSQYLDGDLSLGYDLLSSTLGVQVDQEAIALLDSIFDLQVSGSGSVVTSSGVVDYNLSFDSANNELQAIFSDFDSNTEIISACATGECDWSGQFSFSLNGVNIFDPNASFFPTQLLGSQGSFAFKTNARSGGTVGDFEIATSNQQLQEKIDEVEAIVGNSASDSEPTAVAVQGSATPDDGVVITQVDIVQTEAADVPEPSTIIGLGLLLGLGAVLKDRHEG